MPKNPGLFPDDQTLIEIFHQALHHPGQKQCMQRHRPLSPSEFVPDRQSLSAGSPMPMVCPKKAYACFE